MEGMNGLKIPKRPGKPRETGLTSIMDVGTPTKVLEAVLEDQHSLLDMAKFGVGSAYVTPNLSEKIELYKKYDVQVYFGGSLFEKYYAQGKLDAYYENLRQLGVSCLEVSDGTIEIPLEERKAVVREIKDEFTVLGEVGQKDNYIRKSISGSQWITELQELLEAGCRYVITEGRSDASGGIFTRSGEIKSHLVSDIVDQVDISRVIFEAPSQSSQLYFIRLLGANVNFGNIRIADLVMLEAQRCCLRSETLLMEFS